MPARPGDTGSFRVRGTPHLASAAAPATTDLGPGVGFAEIAATSDLASSAVRLHSTLGGRAITPPIVGSQLPLHLADNLTSDYPFCLTPAASGFVSRSAAFPTRPVRVLPIQNISWAPPGVVTLPAHLTAPSPLSVATTEMRIPSNGADPDEYGVPS